MSKAMEKTVNEMLAQYDAPLAEMVSNVDPRGDLSETFTNVVAGLLGDGRCNWGRVVSVFAFAEQLARHRPDQAELARRLARDAVARDMGAWIAKQGGMASFEATFSEPENASRVSLIVAALWAASLGALGAAALVW